jgi:hypothetical protein
VSNNALTEILKDDLSYNPKTHSYPLLAMVKQVLSQFTNSLSKMIEASEKGFLLNHG